MTLSVEAILAAFSVLWGALVWIAKAYYGTLKLRLDAQEVALREQDKAITERDIQSAKRAVEIATLSGEIKLLKHGCGNAGCLWRRGAEPNESSK